MGSLVGLCHDSRNLGTEVRGIDVVTRRRARRAMVNDTAAARGAHQGERGRHRMGAALGAARNVDRNAATRPEAVFESRVQRRPKRTSRDQPRGASRRARASGDATPGIASTHDEA